MSFTIKYRTYRPDDVQNSAPGSPMLYTAHEQISGPYAMISQEVENSTLVVYAHDDHGDSRCQFGPCGSDFRPDAAPRPTLWVMNENGATVAKYDL